MRQPLFQESLYRTQYSLGRDALWVMFEAGATEGEGLTAVMQASIDTCAASSVRIFRTPLLKYRCDAADIVRLFTGSMVP